MSPISRPKHIDCERCGAMVRDTSDDSLWERHCRHHRDQMHLQATVEHLAARLDAAHPLDPPTPANKDRAPRDGGWQQLNDALPFATPSEVRRFLFGERGER